jgi:hypothetical protein
VAAVVEMLSPSAPERGVALETKIDADLPAIRERRASDGRSCMLLSGGGWKEP